MSIGQKIHSIGEDAFKNLYQASFVGSNISISETQRIIWLKEFCLFRRK